MISESEFTEILEDEGLWENFDEFNEQFMELKTSIERALELKRNYDSLSDPQKVELEIFLMYGLNALHFMKYHVEEKDLTPVREELARVKEVMAEWKKIRDGNLRPRLNKAAVKRFLRSGLYNYEGEESKKRKL